MVAGGWFLHILATSDVSIRVLEHTNVLSASSIAIAFVGLVVSTWAPVARSDFDSSWSRIGNVLTEACLKTVEEG